MVKKKPKPAVKSTTKSGPTFKVRQIASGAGRLRAQNATLKGLGLGKLHRVVELQDTPAIRGMVRKVSHLIEIVG